jgi:hypothetical protein
LIAFTQSEGHKKHGPENRTDDESTFETH